MKAFNRGVFYLYDGAGNLVRSLDILAKKEYTYTYESGVIVAAAEHQKQLIKNS